mgnify:CR=1 FL=1
MSYLYFKALHIIFIVTWFAGLFYIVRLLVYQVEAQAGKNEELKTQLALMAKRLWLGITWPSAIITLIFGTTLLYQNSSWLQLPFMHLKLGFVLLLYAYHFSCHGIYKQLQAGIVKYTSNQLRVWNEVATVLLVSIVFLIVVKDQLSWIWGTLSIFAFAFTLMLAIRIYKKVREKKQNK